ncbi:MAG TPA: hypothetical protein VJY34_20020 [Roseiarcus sp.]|nr:hypothetical protein [Roseiarcus sp.]
MITSTSDRHFLHVNVLLRHARTESGASERDLETILTEAAIGRRRLWVSSILFAELRPSAFVPDRFPTLSEFVRYLRSIATFVTPDPNTMLRAGRLRDVKWQRPAAVRGPGEKPRFLSVIDAIQLASALWVKEAAGVADLEFLAFDDRAADDAEGARLSLLRLQDYADDLAIDSDVMAAVRLARAEPVLHQAQRQTVQAA